MECINLKKKNRSNRFTNGLAITNKTNDARFFFFETDRPFNKEHFDRLVDVYRHFELDVVVHRTGNGWHWLSPTLLSKKGWKTVMDNVKDINTKCPMTTLRIEPNKYPNEKDIWFTTSVWYNADQHIYSNSIELANELNVWFKTKFRGFMNTELKFVRYPLPCQD